MSRPARATALVAALATVASLASTVAAAPRREPVALIDLGPPDDTTRRQLAAAAVAAGLAPLIDDGLDEALAGSSAAPDAAELANAIAEAQRAFGALDCAAANSAATVAIGVAAARQAAGLPVPELAQAWSYRLLCADRASDVDAAMAAAAALRVLGGSAAVPADLIARYPSVDTIVDRDALPVVIEADVPGAEIWIDFRHAGTSPLSTQLVAGTHVIAASSGTRRGWAAGTTSRAQPTVLVPTREQLGAHAKLAARVARWHGKIPAPTELAAVLLAVKARVAIVRRGDQIEAWGRVGRSEPVRRLGADDGVGRVEDAPRIAALIADRVETWNERAPDPDVPLLLEDPKHRGRPERVDEPARWWVYAAVLGAIAAGAGVLYLNESRTNTQRVELRWP